MEKSHGIYLAGMEVDWQGRADERVRFRARIMRDQILRQAAAPIGVAPATVEAVAEVAAEAPVRKRTPRKKVVEAPAGGAS